ncbi:hypothetical protein CC78DRAFT_573514 [Lojkania enalia]|uniref:BHLH domain-containing protein n=1 Tax=Lojkania enalia TaxID=147567 RepID=A0A9P4NDJ2_9PLEO|nr:hypothetical protein CC78DRAFT_573514 [Didymosphaeria enalia]
MNDTGAPSWSGAEQFDPMGAATDHDFSSLLDFDSLDLDFPVDFSSNAHQSHDASRQLSELAESLDVQHLQSQYSPAVSQELRNGTSAAAAIPQQHAQQSAVAGSAMSQGGNNFFEFNVIPYGQGSQPPFSAPPEQIYRPHAGVPPTPNSIEMHGDPARYLQQMDPQQALFEQRQGLRKEETSFTPLVSPAVTPHEARFRVPEFTTVPGAYFSPLTSPALNAQNHQQAHAHASQYTTSGSSAGTSPVDVDMEMLGEAAIAQPSQQGGRSLRSNKRNAPRSSNVANRVRQSPIVKPGRRKATVSSLIPPKEVSELVEEAQRSQSARPSSSGLAIPHSRDSSEADSISPEPMLEMGPPPKPHSTTASPALQAQTKSSQGVAPATPASLMRLQQSPNFSTPSNAPPALDDLVLPEASLARPLSRLDTNVQEDGQTTPQMSARKTPKLGPLSTPSAAAALSGKASPMLSAVASPTSPGFPLGKKGDAKSARNSKKRASVSSTLVSPALRPKISPSIKPLLPEGAVSDDTHALLLASRSNYQNIIDGTTVPGVVYPTSLSTNLTSKRTSHKIAEQGRRNRINTALQEMQALLPSPNGGAKDSKSPEVGSAAQSNNSKAAKVESAIEYIKQLQKECSDKDRIIDQKDQEVEALRKEVAALKGEQGSNPPETASQMKVESEPTSASESENAT